MMRSVLILFFVALRIVSPAQSNNDYIDLFDGKSLDGWEHFLVDPDLKMEDVWSVEDNLLICKGEPMGYLATKNTFTNFKLEVEWRWTPGVEATNSGVLMRISGDPMALPRCTEAQLKHGDAGDIYGFHGFKVSGSKERFLTKESELTGALTGVSKMKDLEKKPGKWNKYEIYLLNGNLTLYINGEKANEATGLDILPGKIGLQSEGGEIQFRTVRLIPMDDDAGNDWPQFHGPNRDNRSNETGLLQSWPEEGPEMIWTAKGLGHGFSSVSVSKGMICTAGNIKGKTVVTAFDKEGNQLWQTINGDSWEDSYPGTRGTPTIEGNRVYHQSPIGNIVCLDSENGEIIWQKNILEEVNSKTNKWALSESLLIDGNNLISCPGGPDASVVALDKISGEIVWKTRSIGEIAGYSSPVLTEIKGLRIIVSLMAKSIIGVNADNGELLWHVMHESYADENVLMPIIEDECVFVSTLKTGSVKWKINVDGKRASLEELWRCEEMDNHHGDVALIDGYLYGTSTFYNRNKWICLDWENGELKYVSDGTGKSSLTYADGKLYTLSIKRLVGLVNPSPEEFEVLSTFEIPEGGEGLSWAHPVVCDGRLYLRHGDFLYTYKIR